MRPYIEDVDLLTGGDPLESGMSMWNDDMVTCMFEGASAEPETLRVQLRRGLG